MNSSTEFDPAVGSPVRPVPVLIRLLGPVEVEVLGTTLDIGHARQRCVLAALAADVNRPVPADRLADRVWADRPPGDARAALYGYLSRLRRLLAHGGIGIARTPAGYLLRCDPAVIDVYRFGELAARARVVPDPTAALAALEAALRLWHGEAFATLDTPWINGRREALNRQRLAVELDRNDHALDRGRHAELLPDLITAADRSPLDERLAGQLMLALYRCGRQADALVRFHRLRVRLAGELGSDPGPALWSRYRQILAADPALLAVPPRWPALGPTIGPVRPVARPAVELARPAVELARPAVALAGPALAGAAVSPGSGPPGASCSSRPARRSCRTRRGSGS